MAQLALLVPEVTVPEISLIILPQILIVPIRIIPVQKNTSPEKLRAIIIPLPAVIMSRQVSVILKLSTVVPVVSCLKVL